MDVDSTEVHVRDLKKGARSNFAKQFKNAFDTPIVLTRSNETAHFWDNSQYWTSEVLSRCFQPGLEGSDMKGRLKFEEWIRHLLNLRDNRFRTYYSFMFVAYNIRNTLSVCAAATK